MTNFDNDDCAGMCKIERSTRVLMIVTNAGRFDEHHRTGVWFEEFAIPYLSFLREGYFVTVSSLKGGQAPLDPASDNLIDDLRWKAAKKILEDTTPLESIDYTLYDAIVFPGGHGPMFDLANSEFIGEIVNYFNENGRIIAAICHGSAAFLPAGSEFLRGKRLTALTNEEEIASKRDGLVPFMLEDELKAKGAVFIEDGRGEVNVIEDKNLITAQNYKSSELFAETVIRHLQGKAV